MSLFVLMNGKLLDRQLSATRDTLRLAVLPSVPSTGFGQAGIPFQPDYSTQGCVFSSVEESCGKKQEIRFAED